MRVQAGRMMIHALRWYKHGYKPAQVPQTCPSLLCLGNGCSFRVMLAWQNAQRQGPADLAVEACGVGGAAQVAMLQVDDILHALASA